MDEIKVGSGGTVSIGSDSYGVTVIEVKGKRICVQWDNARITKGGSAMSRSQTYLHTPNKTERKMWFSLRKTGSYRGMKDKDSFFFYPGERRTYYDPSL